MFSPSSGRQALWSARAGANSIFLFEWCQHASGAGVMASGAVVMRAFAAVLAPLALLLPMSAEAGAGSGSHFLEEVRLGVYQHDSGIVGDQKETGADFSVALLTAPLKILRIVGAPRFVLGAAVNSARQTDQAYIGLIRGWQLFGNVLRPDDSIFLEGVLGGEWNDGKIDVRGTPLEQSWKSHGSHFLFRTGLDLGYRINLNWAVALSFHHMSNAGLASPNEGMNDLGLSINRKL
jgi:lipid A 3-O-deacylase